MRTAAIDIGTNSVLLLVAEPDGQGGIQVVHEACTITRLGKGVDERRQLHPDSIERTLAALRSYSVRMDELGVSQRGAVGTSALRDATNGRAFTEPAAEMLGCSIEVISGKREAQLVKRGVATSFALDADVVIFDVGGGSTELIAVDGGHISLDIGTVRLTERHIDSDPPGETELQALCHDVRTHLRDLADTVTHAGQLIGVAGTVTTLATIEMAIDPYDSLRVNGSQLSRAQIRELTQRLSALPLAKRKQLPGLPTQRADVIVAGGLLVGAVMDHFGVETLNVCDRGVRWGLLGELMAPSSAA